MSGARQPLKALAICAGISLLGYLIVLPMLLPLPTAEADVPATASLTEDLSFEVRLSALHSNYDVAQIRFYVDFYASTAKGEKGLFNPILVFEQRPRSMNGVLAVSHLTWPHTERYTVTVPLREFATQGLVGSGTLAGKVEVTYSYYTPRVGRRIPGADRTSQSTSSVPFSVTITE
jgi:hypothetical protein